MLVAAGLGVLSGGCASRGQTDGGLMPVPSEPPSVAVPSPAAPSAGPPAGPAGPTEPLALPTLSRPAGPPRTPSDQFAPVTVTGRVQVVGEGCAQVVDASGVDHAFVGDEAADLVTGRQVVLRGLPTPDAVTACAGGVLRLSAVLDDGA